MLTKVQYSKNTNNHVVYAKTQWMHVAIKLGVPHPEQIRKAEVLEMIPFGTTELEIVSGGLAVRGLNLPELGAGDTIVIAVAALTVYVDVELEVRSRE